MATATTETVPTLILPCEGHTHTVPVEVVLDLIEGGETRPMRIDAELSCAIRFNLRQHLRAWLAMRDLAGG